MATFGVYFQLLQPTIQALLAQGIGDEEVGNNTNDVASSAGY